MKKINYIIISALFAILPYTSRLKAQTIAVKSDLLTEGHTKLLKGFKSKQGKSFDAVVAFDGEYNTTFVFPEAKKDKKFSGRKK